jgi:vacuolar-type H+-ATPase subunit I/STV1
MVSWIDNFSPQDQFLIIWNYITSFMVDLKEHLSPKLFMIWNYLTSFMVILKNNISLQLLIVLNYLK